MHQDFSCRSSLLGTRYSVLGTRYYVRSLSSTGGMQRSNARKRLRANGQNRNGVISASSGPTYCRVSQGGLGQVAMTVPTNTIVEKPSAMRRLNQSAPRV